MHLNGLVTLFSGVGVSRRGDGARAEAAGPYYDRWSIDHKLKEGIMHGRLKDMIDGVHVEILEDTAEAYNPEVKKRWQIL
jgi:hypothetical protein